MKLLKTNHVKIDPQFNELASVQYLEYNCIVSVTNLVLVVELKPLFYQSNALYLKCLKTEIIFCLFIFRGSVDSLCKDKPDMSVVIWVSYVEIFILLKSFY